MFKSCLICTDFSDGLHRLTDFVPDLAKAGFQKIVFFNSVPLLDDRDVTGVDKERETEVRERLSSAVQNVPEGVEVEIEVISGKPLDTIPRVLKAHPVDVVFTGTPIRSLLQERFFGSTSVGLSKLTDRPLSIIRPQLITTYTTEELSLRCQHLWQYLLIPYIEGKSGRYLVEQIKQKIKNCPDTTVEKIMLITVVEEGGRTAMLADARIKDAESKLEQVKAELEELGVKVNTLVKQGNPITEIMSAALEYDITSIPIATQYRNTLLQWTAPSFANELMRRSWFPILFFSPKK